MSDPRDPKPGDSNDAARRYPDPGEGTRPAPGGAGTGTQGDPASEPAAQPGKQQTPKSPSSDADRRQ